MNDKNNFIKNYKFLFMFIRSCKYFPACVSLIIGGVDWDCFQESEWAGDTCYPVYYQSVSVMMFT